MLPSKMDTTLPESPADFADVKHSPKSLNNLIRWTDHSQLNFCAIGFRKINKEIEAEN